MPDIFGVKDELSTAAAKGDDTKEKNPNYWMDGREVYYTPESPASEIAARSIVTTEQEHIELRAAHSASAEDRRNMSQEDFEEELRIMQQLEAAQQAEEAEGPNA